MTQLHGIIVVVMGASLSALLPSGSDAAPTEPKELHIDADYPGGNILVKRIEGDVVHLQQDLRDTKGWWFYWNFRVRGAAGRTLTFSFAGQSPIGVRGPAVSADGGRNWTWLGAESVKGATFTYRFAKTSDEVRFCFTVPYVEDDLRRFLATYRDNRYLTIEPLCKTRKGRTVERLLIGNPAGDADDDPSYRVLLTARHHACETMANFVLEGFIAAVLEDTREGRWFRQHVAILVIPFVDKDGVEDGDQGKNRKPYDHNRDYKGESIYPSVAAIRTFVPQWSRQGLSMAIDVHCPCIRGPHNEVIYMVGKPDIQIWQRQVAFGNMLEKVQRGPLKYRVRDNVPFGTAWNTSANYGDRMSCSMWAAQLDGTNLATTFEIPYANAAGGVVGADTCRAFGRDLARAMKAYLQP